MDYKHPRARRLKVVLDLAKADEQEALQRWGDSQRKVTKEEEKRTQLTRYADDYQKQLSQPGHGPVSGGNIRNTLGFIHQIDSALQQQKVQLERLVAQADLARQAYLEAHAKVDAMEKMITRLEDSHTLEESRKEQREADEWANRTRQRPTD